MQLYCRVFLTVLDSSIAEDWQCRHVFEDLLKLANMDGVVDMTMESVARRLNIPFDIVRNCITKLEGPDAKSRDQDEGGARLVRLDDHRDWGWRIVNWDKYERIRIEKDLREFNAIRMQRYRSKKASPQTPLKEADTSSDTESNLPVITRRLHVGNTIQTPAAAAPPPRKPAVTGEILKQAEEIYSAYPRKVGKPNAIKAILRQLKSFDADFMLKATSDYAKAWINEPDKTFCPHPATWFNQQRFNDEPSTWKNNEHSKTNQPVNPRNIGICEGVTDYGEAARRKLERQKLEAANRAASQAEGAGNRGGQVLL